MRKHPLFSLFQLSLIALALLVTACGANLAGEPEVVATVPPQPTAMPTVPADSLPDDLPDLATGARLFAQNCTACHGTNGAGNGELVQNGQVGNPGNMTDRAAVAVDSPQTWYTTVTNGNIENLMPPWAGSLSESERWAVSLYTYTLSYTPEQVERGQDIYEQHLAGFDAYDVDDPQAMVTVTDAELHAALTAAAPGDLTEDDIWDAAAYVRTRSLAGVDAIGSSADTLTEPVNAAVTGTIVNGTQDSAPPDDVPVSLVIVEETAEGVQVVDQRDVNSDGDQFTFPDVEINPDYSYFALVPYQERQFISEPVSGSTLRGDALDLPVTVYELTSDQSAITIDRTVYQVSPQADGLQVAQVTFYRNTSDRMFTSDRPIGEDGTQFGSVVTFLPPGAVVAGFGGSNPNRFIVSEEDFAVIDTQPVLPGQQHTVQVIYFLPYDGGAIVEHPLAYQLDGLVRLLVNPAPLDVSSDQLESLGQRQLGEQIYAEYGAELTLEAGEAVRYEISGGIDQATAAANRQSSPRNTLAIVAFSLAALAGVGAIGIFAYGRWNAPERQRNREIDRLTEQIAELDSQHDAGTLNHDVWHQKRNALKAQLRDLMQEGNTDEQ